MHSSDSSAFRIVNDTQIPCEVTLRVASTGQAIDSAQIAPGQETLLPVQAQKLLTVEILYGDGVTMKRDLTAGSQGIDFNLSAFHPRAADIALLGGIGQAFAAALGGGGGIGGGAFQRAHLGRAGLYQQSQQYQQQQQQGGPFASGGSGGLSQWARGGMASTAGMYGATASDGGISFEACNDADAVVSVTVLSADCTTRVADMTIAPGQTERVHLRPDLYCCFVEKEHGSRLRIDLPLQQPTCWSLSAITTVDAQLGLYQQQQQRGGGQRERVFTIVNDSRTGCDLSIHRGGSGGELNKVAGVALGPGQIKEFVLDADWYAVNCHFMSGTAVKRDVNLAENVQWDLSVIHEIRGAAPRYHQQQQQVRDADTFYVNRLGSTGGGIGGQYAPIGQGGLAQRFAARRAQMGGVFARL